MKKIISILSLSIAGFFLHGCSSDDTDTVIGDNQTGNSSLVLVSPASTTGAYALDKDKASEPFDTFTITSPVTDASAVSKYYLQVTLANETFDNGTTFGPFDTNSFTVSNQEMNDLFQKNLYETGYRMRVKQLSVVGNTESVFYSPVMNYNIGGWFDLYAVGGALQAAGWNWDSPLTLTANKGVATLAASTVFVDGSFRFFNQKDWNPTSFNYEYYETRGFSIDPKLINSKDGDSNFKYIGTSGDSYTIVIDYLNKTLSLK